MTVDCLCALPKGAITTLGSTRLLASLTLTLLRAATRRYLAPHMFCNMLMDRIQWLLFKSESDREVTIIDPDRAKALLYDRVNDVVKAVEEPFSWNVSQALPGSDLLL